jgi:murein L,D-transpeptidase YcbB/YkuD
MDVILKFFDFAKKSGLENIAYAITEKIIETFTPTVENSQMGIEIAYANIANNNFDDALRWLNLYELNNLKDQKIDHAKFLIDLNQNDNLNTVINFLSDSNFNFDQINNQSSQESFQVLIDFLNIENILNKNIQYGNISDDRVMPSYFLMNDIKKQIDDGNDLSVLILS